MLEQFIRRLSLDLMVEAVRHTDPTARKQFAEVYWDLLYLYRFGLPRITGLDKLPGPFPPQPQPDPLPMARISVLEEAVFHLAGAAFGDPEPEPNIFSSKAIRLAGAKNLSARLATAQRRLNAEIARLEALNVAPSPP